MRKIISIIFVILLSTSFTSCQDKQDVNHKIFVTMVAFDVGSDYENSSKYVMKDSVFQPELAKRIKVTICFPKVPGTGGSAGLIFQHDNIVLEGYNIDECIRNLEAKSSREVSFDQTKIIIFSKNMLETPKIFKESVESLMKSPNISKQSLVVGIDGNSKRYLDYVPKMESNIQSYISELLSDKNKSDVVFSMNLQKLAGSLNENGKALIPRLSLDEQSQDIDINGIISINNYKYDSVIDRNDVIIIELINNVVKNGKLVSVVDKSQLTFRIDNSNSKTKFIGNKDELKFKVDIEVEGALTNTPKSYGKLNKEKIYKFEKILEKNLENDCQGSVIRIQEYSNVDPFGFVDKIKKFHPNIYENIKDNIDEKIKDAIVIFDIKVKVHNIGEIL